MPNALVEKVGPLPAYVWIIAVGGGILFARTLGNRDETGEELVEEFDTYLGDSSYIGPWGGGMMPLVDPDDNINPDPMTPVIIPIPPGGGIIIPAPGEDPIIVQPLPPPPAPQLPPPVNSPIPPPGNPNPPRQETLTWAGVTFKRNQGVKFKAHWHDQMKKRGRPTNAKAWNQFLDNMPGLAQFFGFRSDSRAAFQRAIVGAIPRRRAVPLSEENMPHSGAMR